MKLHLLRRRSAKVCTVRSPEHACLVHATQVGDPQNRPPQIVGFPYIKGGPTMVPANKANPPESTCPAKVLENLGHNKNKMLKRSRMPQTTSVPRLQTLQQRPRCVGGCGRMGPYGTLNLETDEQRRQVVTPKIDPQIAGFPYIKGGPTI